MALWENGSAARLRERLDAQSADTFSRVLQAVVNQFGVNFNGGPGAREPCLIQFGSVGIRGDALVDGGILFRRGTDVRRLKFGHNVSPLACWPSAN